jgi:hypothetical protein
MWDFIKSISIVSVVIIAGVGVLVASSCMGVPGAVSLGVAFVAGKIMENGLSYLVGGDANHRMSDEERLNIMEQMQKKAEEKKETDNIKSSRDEEIKQKIDGSEKRIGTIEKRQDTTDEEIHSLKNQMNQLQRKLAVITREMPFGEDPMQRGRGFIAGGAAAAANDHVSEQSDSVDVEVVADTVAANDTPARRQQGVRPRR